MAIVHAALFDLDGLLIDSEPLHMRAWQEVAEQAGWPMSDEAIKAFVGKTEEEVAEEVKKHIESDLTAKDLISRKSAIYLRLIRTLRPMPGVKALLLRLKKNHVRMAVVSNSSRETVLASLQFIGIFSYFDFIIAREDAKAPKPSKEPYAAAIRRLNVSPGECIAFEDSETGLASAKAAGVFCVAVPSPHTAHHNFRKADVIADSLETLLGAKATTKNPMIAKLLG